MAATPPEILRLLADPLRWQIVGELGHSDRRVGELVELVGKPQNVVSYHLAQLRDYGIADARRSAADGRDVYYRLDLRRCRELLAHAGGSLHPGLSLAPREHAVPTIVGRPRLLFLCSGNSARSQIAEALAVHRSHGRVSATSAGSHPTSLNPAAVRALAARGIDISNNRAKPLTRFTRHRFDRIITLCDKVREICPEFPGSPRTAHWSVPDPSAPGADDATNDRRIAEVVDDIDDRVTLLLAELATPPPSEGDPRA